MLYRLGHFLLWRIARWVYHVDIEGRENVPRSGPVVLASNPLSFIDSILMPAVVPRPVRYLAKAEYFTTPGIAGAVMRWLFTALGVIPLPRTSGRAAQAQLDFALSILAKSEAFGIYPEGTRSRDGRLYRGRTGVAWLALTADCPVIPVGLVGTRDMMPVGAKFPRLRRVSVRFGTPLEFPQYVGQARVMRSRREVTDQVMDAIAALSGQERAPAYNVPPADDSD